jgi:hypothetical protein
VSGLRDRRRAGRASVALPLLLSGSFTPRILALGLHRRHGEPGAEQAAQQRASTVTRAFIHDFA